MAELPIIDLTDGPVHVTFAACGTCGAFTKVRIGDVLLDTSAVHAEWHRKGTSPAGFSELDLAGEGETRLPG
jgi:uridine phosphorylase